MEGPSEPVEYDFLVKEVVPVKPKRKYTRRRQPLKKSDKEFGLKEVTEYFHKKMGEQKRSYDSVNCKWKDRIRLKVSQCCEIYNSVKDRHQTDSKDVDVQEVALIGRDRQRGKHHYLVLVRKLQLQRNKSSSEYLRIKERELELEDQKRQEQGELERLKIAKRDKELDLQKKYLNFNNNKNGKRTSSITMKIMSI
nr:hypothetical protein [Tanacetum cinerariifolium]